MSEQFIVVGVALLGAVIYLAIRIYRRSKGKGNCEVCRLNQLANRPRVPRSDISTPDRTADMSGQK